jgi:hypothetical protein
MRTARISLILSFGAREVPLGTGVREESAKAPSDVVWSASTAKCDLGGELRAAGRWPGS